MTRDRVLDAFHQQSGLPRSFLDQRETLEADAIARKLRERFIGQPDAVNAAVEIISIARARLNDPTRPIVSLLMQSNGEPSDFLQQIRRQPFIVLLLDEIEKAHPSVDDILMNVFDEGRLSDRFGRVTWFRSTVILLTSNLEADSSEQAGFADARISANARYESAVREFFRPEFFLRKPGLTLTWTPEVVQYLAYQGYDPKYGARPLQRTLETLVVAPLSRFIVEQRHLSHFAVHLTLNADRNIQLK